MMTEGLQVEFVVACFLTDRKLQWSATGGGFFRDVGDINRPPHTPPLYMRLCADILYSGSHISSKTFKCSPQRVQCEKSLITFLIT